MSASPTPSVPVWIVHPVIRGDDSPLRTQASRLDEACSLADSIGLRVKRAEQFTVRQTRPATLLGIGVLESLRSEIAHAAEAPKLVLFNVDLTPVQQRNLEDLLRTKVLDRTALILEIFGARAATREGRLQVELAHLEWQRSRLVRSWTHLERQRGGFGFLGGPGESQIEIDRRLITGRVARIRKELDHVRRRRGLHRRRRTHPTVALVGYTNAGKSTLFSQLTGQSTDARNLPFTTLDPLMRACALPSGRTAVFSDTVGFVSNLPTLLIAAFRATLEEAVHADLLVHVRDITHPETAAQRLDVISVLTTLGALHDGAETQLEVLNKIDRFSEEDVRQQRDEQPRAILASGLRGTGMRELLEAVDRCLGQNRSEFDVELALADTSTLAWLHRKGAVVRQRADAGSLHVRVALDPADRGRLNARLAKASPTKTAGLQT